MRCPRCGQEILDPDPTYCPKCGFEVAKAPLPSSPVTERGQPQKETSENPSTSTPLEPESGGISGRYYLLPLLAIVGGVIGYRAVKKYNPRVAATILTIGLLVSLVYVGVGVEVYSRVAGSPGTYGMTITEVSFPNPTTVVVTVANQGTLEDGLESVAINNGTLWLVYGLLSPDSAQASSELQSGNLIFSLYGYILANGTTLPAGNGPSAVVGTEGFPPTHTDQVTIPFAWTPVSPYKVFISTQSAHPNQVNVTSPA